MNNIELGPGTVYIDGQGIGTTRGIPEVKLCSEEDDYTEQKMMYNFLSRMNHLNGSFATFSASIKMATDAFTRMVHASTGITKELEDNCPNKRVVHLWRHGKNWRVRKKNYKRMIEYAEKCRKS